MPRLVLERPRRDRRSGSAPGLREASGRGEVQRACWSRWQKGRRRSWRWFGAASRQSQRCGWPPRPRPNLPRRPPFRGPAPAGGRWPDRAGQRGRRAAQGRSQRTEPGGLPLLVTLPRQVRALVLEPPRRDRWSGSAPGLREASGQGEEERGGWWCWPRWRKERRRSWRWKRKGVRSEGKGGPAAQQGPQLHGACTPLNRCARSGGRSAGRL